MVMEGTERPKYVEDAAFIELERDVDEDWWFRDPAYYMDTANWKNRVLALASAVPPAHVDSVIEHGDLYPAAKGNVAFVTEENGVATYAVVAAELQKRYGKYPTDPTKTDYRFKKVTFWAYVYDRDEALESNMWTRTDLQVINSVCG